MPFAEALKADLRRRADFCCCICHAIGVEIHHIIPTSEGGTDQAENAAPLCPSCHETYGANPLKRKFIREARDAWFDRVAMRAEAGPGGISDLIDMISALPTRDELGPVLRSLRQPSATSAPPHPPESQTATLGQIINYLFDLPAALGHTRPQLQVFFEFLFGGTFNHEEFDETKNQFVRAFGRETALRFCSWILKDHPFDAASPFTANQLWAYANDAFNGMILLLMNQEIAAEDNAIAASFTDDRRDLLFWPASRRRFDQD